MRIAQIQMNVTADKGENIRHACELIRQAAAQSVDLAMLPEMFCCLYDNAHFAPAAEPEGGEAQQALSALAKELGIWIIGGSVPEIDGHRLYNTCYVFDDQGRTAARHRKTHLFDIDVKGGQRFMESDTFTAGSNVTTFETPWGLMGLCICFDMRFEELSRLMTLRGARAIFVPAAFNMTTGPAHWQLLFRQRAVDNQLFTIATSPARSENAPYVAWGHSLVCNPWGTVLHECDEKEHVSVTELDFQQVNAIREQLPILRARRTDLYKIAEK